MSPFTTKDWKDDPDHSTPVSAAALKDLEARLAAYTDTRAGVACNTHAARPAASAAANTLYYETDTGLTFVSDGSAWQLVKPGAELGYAEITSVFSTTNVYPSWAAVTGLSRTVTVSARPVKVIFDASYYDNTTAGDSAAIGIFEDGSVLSSLNSSGVPGKAVEGHREVRRTPAAGSHTYDIRLCALTGGTAQIGADAIGGTYGPAFIQVIEL